MHVNEIFEKDINREIEGVIKADDASQIGVEVDEYVLTNEASKGLELLLEAYTDPRNTTNGVWVSGFFGSGKSHLLKMLAHLLGDVSGSGVDRDDVSEAFLRKAGDNAILKALVRKASTIPARSLLFNIDQKAGVIAKDQTDALVKVFVKVFDEACGYYDRSPYVAQFERDLDRTGKLDEFKEAYAEIAGIPWEEGRELIILQSGNVDEAYARVTGIPDKTPEGILDKYRDDYQLSIEDFAKNVASWLDEQEPGTRLNFYVDEVGQFIGGNTKLMLNLQTVSETLATHCQGRAWVMVTSQEDMDSVIGDQTSKQGNDFSKIQARFKTRLKLTSADVEEVIQKRILEKNAGARAALKGIYADQFNNFETLFQFVDGSRTYRNFADEDHFIASYPFVTYQFPLIQAAIIGISQHNGFEGRHAATGERSMLEVFQHVARGLDMELGGLATFDASFEGIRSTLKTAAQQSIITAEDNLRDKNPLAIRVLKALFLVKYVPDFKATTRNITVLLYDRFGQDLEQLNSDVREALDLLEQQTYIQRNGTLYEYLTNDEKDIEEEIKSEEVDSTQLKKALGDMIHEILQAKKIRYLRNGQDFPYALKVDDFLIGQPRDLAINIITSENEFAGETPILRAHTVGKDELRVVLPEDDRLIPDLLNYLRTKKYVRQARAANLTDSHHRILQAKSVQNDQRHRELTSRLRDLLGSSTLMMSGSNLEVTLKDGGPRIEQGFQHLVDTAYPQLTLLGTRQYSEGDVSRALDSGGPKIDDDATVPLSDAEKEVFSHIRLREAGGDLVTVATIVKNFESKPYGWSMYATLTQLAHMVALGRVTLTLDANKLTGSTAAASLKNTKQQSAIIVSVQQQYTPEQTWRLRKFHQDFFDTAESPADAADIAKACAQGFAELANRLEALIDTDHYPFTEALPPVVATLRAYSGKPEKWLVEDLPGLGDSLLDAKEDSIDRITGFFGGTQRGIFDQAANLLTQAESAGAGDHASAERIRTLLADPDLLSKGKIPQLKTATGDLSGHLNTLIETARESARKSVDQRARELTHLPEWEVATPEARSAVEQRLESLLEKLAELNSTAAIHQAQNTFANVEYPKLIDLLVPDPQPVTVSLDTLDIGFQKALLQTEQEVDEYLAALREALMAQVNEGHKVVR